MKNFAPHSASIVTPEAIREARALLEALTPIVGVALSPQAITLLKAKDLSAVSFAPSLNALDGVPFISDPRLTLDQNQVYFSVDEWQERCQEQKRFDFQNKTTNEN